MYLFIVHYFFIMSWTVSIKIRAQKAIDNLPNRVRQALMLLVQDMEMNGPVRGNWPNYGKLAPHRHHCHLKKGHPTYVAIWEDSESGLQIIEVTYAGTHERAPY